MRRFWLHLTIGFLISAVGLWIFLGVTEDVLHHDPLTQFDVTLVDWFQAHHGPAADQVFRAITALGSPLVLISVALGVAVFLVISKQSLLLNGWLLAFAGGALLNYVLKRAIQRPRPYSANASLAGSWRFPSGHAKVSPIGDWMLADFLMLIGPR